MKLKKTLVPEFIWPKSSHADLCQPKIDGWSCTVRVANNRAVFTARNGGVIAERPAPQNAPEITLFGELIHGTTWARGRADYGTLLAFDCKTAVAMPYGARLARVREFLTLHPIDRCQVMETRAYTVKNFPELQNYFVRENGFEGLVFRDSADCGNNILVAKEKITWDFYATKLYRGSGGNYIAGLAGYPGGEEIFRCVIPQPEANDIEGKCLEIEGSYRTARAAVQSPVFMRWRADKDASGFPAASLPPCARQLGLDLPLHGRLALRD